MNSFQPPTMNGCSPPWPARWLPLERLRLWQQTQEQARRVQQIVDTMPEGVLLLDAQERVVLANPTAGAIWLPWPGPRSATSSPPGRSAVDGTAAAGDARLARNQRP
ncbi:MAG: PAS domain-containing protein [Anaerolineae bacterium]|uniref:PAS domain-containing protein n=1 Tax=Candidatus Amarolinea dominans TaxID=3140696 RepID=UPI00313613CF|nr:PAS domain-containing protein [Anaerolineae bacterium]